MIKINHLTKTFVDPDGTKLQVLKDINCEIQKGEVISIIGPSGTGKSTLLRAINMMDPPTSGEIIVDGQNILDKGYPLNRLRQKVGMVFQSFNLFEHLSVIDNITKVPMLITNISRQEAEEEAMTLLRKVGMAEKAHAMPSDLSGGQKQRVAIARCLAIHPEVILFDEPTSALDPTMVGEVLSVIRQLAKEGMTMLIVTHEMKFAHDVSTRIFFMYDGYIHEDGTPQQIFEAPIHSATKAFVQRIYKQMFEVDGPDFDFLGMHSSMSQFCVKYNIAQKSKAIEKITTEMINNVLPTYRPLTVRLTFSDHTDTTALDFMIAGLDHSPLQADGFDPRTMDPVRPLAKEIIEEPTTRGFRIKIIV
ncbi:MAG: amino acid ABC transporter ATP-binding protein [Bacteroidales bacterium]|nr:amino acid ABC transporter ATP-binding protein [Bacteroidales bacterium]